MGVTQTLGSINSLLNDISQTLLPSKNPGQRPTKVSDSLLDYLPQCVPPEGEKTLSVITLLQREMTPSFHTPLEGGKDSLCKGGRPLVYSLMLYLSKNKFRKNQTQQWEADKIISAKTSIPNLIAGYKLPFMERPILSRIPCITSGYADFNKVLCQFLFKTCYAKVQSRPSKN